MDYQSRKAERIRAFQKQQGLKLQTCGACSGSGRYKSGKCGLCQGTGKTRETELDRECRVGE